MITTAVETPVAADVRGTVFDIQRFCIHDGPGIRTTVFLKGCPLRCLWCHNPEGGPAKRQLAWYASKCIKCGCCYSACPFHVIVGVMNGGDERVDRARCHVCGSCARACPAEALQLIGRLESVESVLDVVKRDVPFYRTSGGGMTISGGEPLSQWEFTRTLVEEARREGIHTAIETSGFGEWERLESLATYTDLFLYDLKVISRRKHRRLCGVDNARILENARKLSAAGARVLFRTPIVPRLNDRLTDIRALADFVLSLPGRHRLELMPYHRIGAGKYEALGLTYPIPEVQPPANLARVERLLADAGVELASDGAA